MNIFISGGCKNGKSLHAQELAKEMADVQHVPLYYIATMIPADDEDRLRIKKHLEARDGWGFITVEKPTHLMGMFEDPDYRDMDGNKVDPRGAFLLDSVTALLSNEMFGPNGEYDEKAGDRVKKDVVDFAEATGNTVFVSDFIYSDARSFDDWTENYRRSLAMCDRALAKICGRVIDTSFGTFTTIKG